MLMQLEDDSKLKNMCFGRIYSDPKNYAHKKIYGK